MLKSELHLSTSGKFWVWICPPLTACSLAFAGTKNFLLTVGLPPQSYTPCKTLAWYGWKGLTPKVTNTSTPITMFTKVRTNTGRKKSYAEGAECGVRPKKVVVVFVRRRVNIRRVRKVDRAEKRITPSRRVR